jgi:hypothetical protein
MRFTLHGEGNSDECLKYLLEWLLNEYGVFVDINDHQIFFEKSTKIENIFSGTDYWTDVLFIHRDADSDTEKSGKGYEARKTEIDDDLTALRKAVPELPSHVVVIPVQETESWLLASEKALLAVARKERPIADLPKKADLEKIGNPKKRLCSILRNLELEIGEDKANTRLWMEIMLNIKVKESQSYGVLRGIPSFDRLESAVKKVVDEENLRER